LINWKVRLKNKLFLATLASQTALMAQGVLAGLVGLDVVNIDLTELGADIKIGLGIVDTVLFYLSFLGVVQDPTTKGVADSPQAMTYDKPKN
jgi:phi LC3 family holin